MHIWTLFRYHHHKKGKINAMRISNFSKITGLPVSTVRYYMEIGLLTPKKGKYTWDFSERDVLRASEIMTYKQCGIPLETIQVLLDEPIDATAREEILKAEQLRILEQRTAYSNAIAKLDEFIATISVSPQLSNFRGVPLEFIPLIQCPSCKKLLSWSDVAIYNNEINAGVGTCSCNFTAKIENGILIADNAARPILLPVDRSLHTIRKRSAQDTSYIEKFNLWLRTHLLQIELSNRIIYEDVLNTCCFMNRIISSLPDSAYYILCDTDEDIVAYYASSIRAQAPTHKCLFIVDDGIHHPLKENCLDVVIDYAASEIYQKYGFRSASTPLRNYVKNNAYIIGRFSRLVKKAKGERDPSESTPYRYQLPIYLSDMKNNGITLYDTFVGDQPLDPSVYTGALAGDIIKPYAFCGKWEK